jgi:hypothetical protein
MRTAKQEPEGASSKSLLQMSRQARGALDPAEIRREDVIKQRRLLLGFTFALTACSGQGFLDS